MKPTVAQVREWRASTSSMWLDERNACLDALLELNEAAKKSNPRAYSALRAALMEPGDESEKPAKDSLNDD